MKTINCREHGGTFQIAPRRGRPPVKCTADNQCTAIRKGKQATAPQVAKAAERAATAPRRTKLEHSARVAPSEARIRQAEAVSESPNGRGAGVAKAFEAKALLEAQGWEVQGSKEGDMVTATATRGSELLVMTWQTSSGELLSQDYTLWNIEVGKGRNGKPAGKLPFDPDETPDIDVVMHLKGMKVQWWNALAQNTETAVIKADSIKIEHSYNGMGDETPGDRIIKFIDHSGSGFRAFRLAALLRVGH